MAQFSERQAFDAMRVFLERFCEDAGDDMLTLLSDITVMPDGTFDPAACDDWMRCVERVIAAQ